MSKKSFMTGVLIAALAAVCVVAATAEEMKEKTWQHLSSAAEKQKLLKVKVYSGTWEELLGQRAADVNEVAVDIAVAKEAAVEAIELGGRVADPNAVKAYIRQTIEEKAKEKEHKQKLGNVTFLIDLEQVLADNPPDPEDLEEQERLEELRTACLVIVNENGGV